jgi:YgiT-type zinc finger domain-containing protein
MKRCPICEGEVEKVRTKIEVEGVVLAEDYEVEKCKKCGEEFYTLEQMSFLRKRAEEKGMWGHGLKLRRKITKSGKRLALYIPADVERILKLKKGKDVEIWVEEDGR